MLHGIVSKTDTLLEKKDDILAKACGGLYLFKNFRVLVLTFELICIFSAANAFITAAAVELHRNGFSSAWIGMLTTPSGLMQCLLSQWAGRLAGSAQNRERILLYTPILLGVSLLIIGALAKSIAYLAGASSLISTTSTLLVPILSTLIVSSAALGAADVPWQRCFLFFSCPNPCFLVLNVAFRQRTMRSDTRPFHLIPRDTLGYCSSARYLHDPKAPAMSMMADLAASEGLGYGQALTASEMAINAGSKTCLLLRLLLLYLNLPKSINTLKSSCVFPRVISAGAVNDVGCTDFCSCLSFMEDVFFQAWPWVHRWQLWLWQQIGTILRSRSLVQRVHYSLQP